MNWYLLGRWLRKPRYWPTLLLIGLLHLLCRLPYRPFMGLAWALAFLLAPFARSRRRIIDANLALCFPEQDRSARKRLARRNVRSTLVSVFESAYAFFAPRDRTENIAHIEGLEHLQAALAERRGALLLIAHFTMLELAARTLTEAFGIPLHELVRRNNNACMEFYIDRGRRRYCGETIEKKDLMHLRHSLRHGHGVWYAPDQNFNLHMAFVPFFGQPAATLTATSRIAASSRVPVIPIWFHRKASGYGYEIRVEPKLSNFPTSDAVADTAHLMALIEAQVREHPEQYLWAHRRFKTRPEGTADAYE